LLLIATLAVTGTPPFSLFQREFTTLTAALAANHPWPAALFIGGVATIFAGFLYHMSRLNLGRATKGSPPARECPWKLAAMVFVTVPAVAFGFIMPGSLHELIRTAAHIIEGVS
jgi:hydrogenase-4 component F